MAHQGPRLHPAQVQAVMFPVCTCTHTIHDLSGGALRVLPCYPCSVICLPSTLALHILFVHGLLDWECSPAPSSIDGHHQVVLNTVHNCLSCQCTSHYYGFVCVFLFFCLYRCQAQTLTPGATSGGLGRLWFECCSAYVLGGPCH